MSMQAEAVDQEPVEIKEEPIQIDVKVKEEHDEFLEILPSTSKSILDDDKEDLRASLKIEHEQDIKIIPSTSKFDSEDDFFDEDQGKKEMPEFKEEMMSEDEDDESDFEQEGLSDDGGEGPSNIKTEELMIKSESGESDSSEIDVVSDEGELTKHETTMHTKPTGSGDFMSDYTRYLTQYACDFCEYKTYNMRILDDHVLDCHQTIRRCSRCSFITINENDYKEHKLSLQCIDTRKYACDHCEYKCRYHTDMKKHTKQQHGKILKQHFKTQRVLQACNFCDYNSNNPNHLRTHIKARHDKTAVKKHACQQCGYRSHYKFALNKHVSSKHHKNTPIIDLTK